MSVIKSINFPSGKMNSSNKMGRKKYALDWKKKKNTEWKLNYWVGNVHFKISVECLGWVVCWEH